MKESFYNIILKLINRIVLQFARIINTHLLLESGGIDLTATGYNRFRK